MTCSSILITRTVHVHRDIVLRRNNIVYTQMYVYVVVLPAPKFEIVGVEKESPGKVQADKQARTH